MRELNAYLAVEYHWLEACPWFVYQYGLWSYSCCSAMWQYEHLPLDRLFPSKQASHAFHVLSASDREKPSGMGDECGDTAVRGGER